MALSFTNTALQAFATEGLSAQVGNTLEEEASEKEYIYDKCMISYVITEKHYEGYNVNVVITNTSNEEICDWKLQMVTDFSIENIWNAFQEKNGDSLLIEDAGWNRTILPGQQASFGFCVKSKNISFPDITWLEESTVMVDESDYNISYEITNDWGQGYIGQIKVTNLSDSPIRNWKLSFSSDNNITNIWNAINVSTQYGNYELIGSDSRESLNVGETLDIGFEVNQGSSEIVPIGFKLEKQIYSGSCEDNPNQDEEPIPTEKPVIVEDDIHFSISEDWFVGDNTSKTIYFYALIDSMVDKVVLHDITNDKYYNMYDNGAYSSCGDDIAGDNMYSSKSNIFADSSVDQTLLYEVIVNDTIKSPIKEIRIAHQVTQEEMDNIDYLNDYLTTIWNEISEESTVEERYEIFYEKLTFLKENGHIKTFNYDENTEMFETSYLLGLPLLISIEKVVDDEVATDGVGGNGADFNNDIMMTAANVPEADQGNLSGITIAIANCFDDAKFRNDYYKELVNTLSMMGAKVEFEDNLQIPSLLKLINHQDIICIGAHGIEDGGGIVLYDDIVDTVKSSTAYYEYINKGWIISYTSEEVARKKHPAYTLTSDFFENELKSEQVTGSMMYFQSCYFLNKWQVGDGIASYNTYYADVFLNKGAICLVAGQNEVAAKYDQVMMNAYLSRVLKGATAKEALDEAKELYGESDYKYDGLWFDDDRDNEANGILHLLGDENSTLNTGFVNGDFEISSNAEYAKPFKWSYEGDVRVLPCLGNIWAFDSKMAFISTGIGSSDGVNLNAGQGSKLSQTFYNRNATAINFSYDVVSEEPMEYVNSQFDDYFAVNIFDADGKLLASTKLESINSSKWNHIEGINFDGGDSTVYHTGWKNQTLDISKYQNQKITIEFIVADVGDSAYDTAALIDNVVVK